MKTKNMIQIAMSTLALTLVSALAHADDNNAMGGNPGVVPQDTQQIKELTKDIKQDKVKRRADRKQFGKGSDQVKADTKEIQDLKEKRKEMRIKRRHDRKPKHAIQAPSAPTGQ